MSNMKIEFVIDANKLGAVVLMVEDMGATDFTFVTMKKKPRKKYTRQIEPNAPAVKGKGAEIVAALLRKNGPVDRDKIGEALKKGGMSVKTLNGLLSKMRAAGMVDLVSRGTYKLHNGAVA